jgi:hypothetical protein
MKPQQGLNYIDDATAAEDARREAFARHIMQQAYLAPKWALRNLERISLEFDENLGGLRSVIL